MIGTTVSHYKILEKLGEGGMGVVYKAQDLKLNRLVALKFLPQHIIAKPTDKARFLQEAQAAALLNHPNICAIYGIHDDGDEQFIELEFVDGMTIRDRLPIQKISEALDFAIQVGEGLQEAHGKGIVHRDIKSENIMLNSRGHVKVMDFGLAKLKGSAQLTQSSTTVGTLAYTAPEQVQGAQADPRSDIFSFGVVLYEMLTDRVPFRGEHQAALMYSIVNEEPEPMEKYRPNVPPDVLSIVSKALEKNPAERYQTVADMVVDLRRARRKTQGTFATTASGMKDQEFAKSVEELGRRTVTIPMMKQRKRAFLYSALGFLVLGALIVSYLMFFKQGETLSSLAVMPFTNATGDQSLDYLTDGITESVINNLSSLSNLRVMSRASVFRYKGKEIDPQEVGKTLGVQAVLTGRITRRPEGFSLRLELVDSRDNRQIWGDHYVRSLSEISNLETEIPKEISTRLRVSLGGEEQQRLTKASTGNTEAYQLYLKGRYNWNMRSPESLRRAIDLYSQAIEKDPLYVLALTGLAETYVVMPVYIFPPPRNAYEKARYYALKALEIDPKRAEAFSVLGYAKWAEFDFDGGEKDHKHALALNPNYATAHQWYQILLSAAGRHDEALAEIRKAQELDPSSLIIQTNLGSTLEMAGRYEEAIAQYRKVLEVEPNFPLARLLLGRSYMATSQYSKAIQEFEKAQAALGGIVSPYLAIAYAFVGKQDQAQKILAQLEALVKKGEKVEAPLALVHMALGEKKKAAEWLERLYESRFINIVYYPDVRDLPKRLGMDSDPRILAALKKIGVR